MCALWAGWRARAHSRERGLQRGTGGQRAERASRNSLGDAGAALPRATAPHARRAFAEPVARGTGARAAAAKTPNVPGCFGELRSRGWFRRGVTRKAQWRCRREWNCIYSEVAKFGGSRLLNSTPCAGEVLELTPWAGGEPLRVRSLLLPGGSTCASCFGMSMFTPQPCFLCIVASNCSCGICGNKYPEKNVWDLLPPPPAPH